MNIGIAEAAKILSASEDELMYHVQCNKIKAMTNQDTLQWEFDLHEVLQLKEALTVEDNDDLDETGV